MSYLDQLVDPSVGIVLGYCWGSKAGQFLQDHPDAVLVRDEADIQEYQLPESIAIAGVELELSVEFRLDELITLKLEPSETQRDTAFDPLGPLVEVAGAWFAEPLVNPDEGLWIGEEAGTRMSIDTLELRVVFLDAEQ